ncbi:MAG: peptidoglycan DD-metalloendopeptidase family protein [Desulfobulbus sp.]|nr:peptidoglycan DD-metalloendopeptidase family protein [Desulfobulbus sp.]
MFRCLTTVCICLLITVPLPVISGTDEESASSNVITIGKLRQEMAIHQEKINEVDEQERSLLEELAILDKKIEQQKTKIQTLQTKIDEQKEIIAGKEQELTAVNKKNETLQQHLLKRLRSFYLLGQTGSLHIVFSKSTLPDLMLTNDAFGFLSTYDKEVFAQYRASVLALTQVKQARELERTVQEHFLQEAATENELLQQIVAEKNELLERTQTEKELYQQAVREMKKAEAALLATLTQNSPTQTHSQGSFLTQKKKLPPPVWGKIIRYFHEPSADEDTTFINGISIQPPESSEVFAVYDGEVIYSGYMSGYGRMVVIEHDQNYYSITSRLEDIRVLEGDVIKQGQIIGTSSDSTDLFGEGLYFEIRHGAQPENPLEWIQPGALVNR